MAKVLLIYPDITGLGGKYNHGVGLLASIIKQSNHIFKLIHLTDKNYNENYITKIEEFRPDIVLFSVTTNQYKYFKEILKVIKSRINVTTCLGGIHATLSYKQVLIEDNIDIVNVGDGENSIKKILANYNSLENLIGEPNICLKLKGKIYECAQMDFTENIDELPFEDFSVFDSELLEIPPAKQLDILTSRGCIYNCSYCCNKALYKECSQKIRRRSPRNVIDELILLKKKYNPKEIKFDDDIFTYDFAWMKELCKLYSNKIDIPFQINTRVELIDKTRLEILKKTNCRMIRMGIESGNEWLRKHILHRYNTNEQIISAFSLVKSYGIHTLSYNMIGLPFETKEMAMETYKLNKNIMPYLALCSVFYPYPKTDLYEICIQYGFIKDKFGIANWYEFNSICDYPQFSNRAIKKVYNKMEEFIIDHQINEHYKSLKYIKKLFSIFLGSTVSYLICKNLLRLSVKRKMK